MCSQWRCFVSDLYFSQIPRGDQTVLRHFAGSRQTRTKGWSVICLYNVMCDNVRRNYYLEFAVILVFIRPCLYEAPAINNARNKLKYLSMCIS